MCENNASHAGGKGCDQKIFNYTPSKKTWEERELTRIRYDLLRTHISHKNAINRILLQKGIEIDGDKFAHPGTSRLRQIGDYIIDEHLRNIEVVNDSIARMDAKIENAIMENPDAQLLLSIKGVEKYAALAIAASIGDISRFPDSSRLCSYMGVSPPAGSSADARYERAAKRGSRMMRWILAESVKSHVEHEPSSKITKFYLRIKEKNKYAADTASSAKMLRVMYWMLKEKKEFAESTESSSPLSNEGESDLCASEPR